MPSYRLLQVDAFTTEPLAGNACAVVLDADPIDDGTLQAIAREMNLSETAFVLRSERADFRARYFTPSSEIPMAGHPTLATAWALLETGRIRAPGTISLELPVGPVRVDLEPDAAGRTQLVMTQPAPVFGPRWAPEEVLPVFGLAAEAARGVPPIQTVSTGTPQLMVPLAEVAALHRAEPDPKALGALCEQGGVFSVHLFCTQGVTNAGDTTARHFVPPPRPFEDPFTGSATGAMGAFLWHHGILESPRFVAEQGHAMQRPGTGFVDVLGPRDAIEGVRVGGHAVTVLEGELRL